MPAHAPVAGDHVGLGVRAHVPGVEGAADRRRRRVDRVDLRAGLRAVEAVGAVALPDRAPLLLEAFERRLLGCGRFADGHGGETLPGAVGAPRYRFRVLRLHDTASGTVRELALREPGKVSMYVCGPTVYGPPHLGHGRFSLVFDVLRRYLEWTGLEVALRVEHHRHRRQHHRPGQARGPLLRGGRGEVRGRLVRGDGRASA